MKRCFDSLCLADITHGRLLIQKLPALGLEIPAPNLYLSSFAEKELSK